MIVDERGRNVGDALMVVAYWLFVGGHEGVHHDVSSVILDPSEDEIAVVEALVLRKADARPPLDMF